MLWSFKLSVCLLIVVFGIPSKAPTEKNQRKAMGSYFQNMTRELGMQKDSGKRQFQCRWNCQLVESDLVNIIQTTVLTEGRKLRLAFHYEKIVEDDCVSKTSRTSNGNLTEYWQVWLVNNTLRGFAGNIIRGFSVLIQASFEDQVKVFCRFRKTNSSGKGTLYGELYSPSEHLDNILRSTVKSLGDVCDAQSETDTQACIQISKFNLSARWKDFVLHGLIIAFVTIFTYFGPTVVCLYSATEDTLSGIRQITVEGPSPVGFRSLIGNYFFSTDNDMWHRARKFIMRVFLLPIPYLAPAIFVEYLLYQNLLPQQNVLRIAHLFQPFRMFCYGCYYAHAFNFHILQGKPPVAEGLCCLPFGQNKPFEWVCVHRDLPQRMLGHLRSSWYIVMLVLGIPKEGLVMAKKRITDPNCFRASCSRNLLSLLHILFGILWLTWLFVNLPPFVEFYIALSFPIATLCITTDLTRLWHVVNIHFLPRELLFAVRVVVVFLNIPLSCFAALGVMFVLRSAALGVIIFLQLAVAFMLSENNLPLVACCVLSFLNLWISYRSFTQKYQDLAVNLFEHWHDTTPDYRRATGIEKRIPKDLFEMACEVLMPMRKTICTLVVKTLLSMIFIFFVFSLTMLLNTSTMMQSLMAFLAGSLPMIVNICLNRRKQNNLEEKALKVVQEYIKCRLPPNPRQQSAHRSNFKDGISLSELFIHCFISLVVYLSFNICSSTMAHVCFMRIVGNWKFPSTPSEISQVIYQYPSSTSGLVCNFERVCKACSR